MVGYEFHISENMFKVGFLIFHTTFPKENDFSGPLIELLLCKIKFNRKNALNIRRIFKEQNSNKDANSLNQTHGYKCLGILRLHTKIQNENILHYVRNCVICHLNSYQQGDIATRSCLFIIFPSKKKQIVSLFTINKKGQRKVINTSLEFNKKNSFYIPHPPNLKNVYEHYKRQCDQIMSQQKRKKTKLP